MRCNRKLYWMFCFRLCSARSSSEIIQQGAINIKQDLEISHWLEIKNCRRIRALGKYLLTRKKMKPFPVCMVYEVIDNSNFYDLVDSFD
ncbi:hypothetical protein F5Y10DRAFT_30120 [Nemania abortiva]|nr:hypothetical protein F5Y10DRAFT_30120 [Nemania abortiva]